jgi:hypothetical protein
MRTTITFADDVAAALEKARRERGIGLSEAVNDLVRAGLVQRQATGPVEVPVYDMGIGIDVSDIGEAIEQIERGDPPQAA